MRKPTERQQFIIDLRKSGKTLDEIGILYHQRFKTKVKMPRERVRMILAQYGIEYTRNG